MLYANYNELMVLDAEGNVVDNYSNMRGIASHMWNEFNDNGKVISRNIVKEAMRDSIHEALSYDEEGRLVLIKGRNYTKRYHYNKDGSVIEIYRKKDSFFDFPGKEYYCREYYDVDHNRIIDYNYTKFPFKQKDGEISYSIIMKYKNLLNGDCSEIKKNVINGKVVKKNKCKYVSSFLDQNHPVTGKPLLSSLVITRNGSDTTTNYRYYRYEFDNEIFLFTITEFDDKSYTVDLIYKKKKNETIKVVKSFCYLITTDIEQQLSTTQFERSELIEFIKANEFKVGYVEIYSSCNQKIGLGKLSKWLYIKAVENGKYLCRIYRFDEYDIDNIPKLIADSNALSDSVILDIRITDIGDSMIIEPDTFVYNSIDEHLYLRYYLSKSLALRKSDLLRYDNTTEIIYSLKISESLTQVYHISLDSLEEELIFNEKVIKRSIMTFDQGECRNLAEIFKEELIGEKNKDFNYYHELHLLNGYLMDSVKEYKNELDLF